MPGTLLAKRRAWFGVLGLGLGFTGMKKKQGQSLGIQDKGRARIGGLSIRNYLRDPRDIRSCNMILP